MENRLAREVIKIVADAVGDFIAKAIVNRNCERMGIKPDMLDARHISALARGVEKSLVLFADAETGRAVAGKIRELGEPG